MTGTAQSKNGRMQALRDVAARVREDNCRETASLRVGRRLWWVNGIPEATAAIGLALMLVPSLIAATAGSDSWLSSGTAVTLTRVIMLIALLSTPAFLYRHLLAPLGAGVLQIERKAEWWNALILGALLGGGAVFGWATDALPDTSAVLALLAGGCPLALPAVALFGYSGQTRHLVLIGTLLAAPPVFAVSPQGMGWLGPGTLVIGLAICGVWGIWSVRGTLRNPPSLDALVSALESADPLRRFGAVELLHDWMEPRVIPWLVKASQDPDELVRSTAAGALWRLWGPDAEVVFDWHLQDSGVARVRDAQLDESLLDAFGEDFENAAFNVRQYRSQVVQALRNALEAHPWLWADLLALAESDSALESAALARDAALMLLVASGRDEGIDFAIRRLDELDEPGWFAASHAFVRGDEYALARLESALTKGVANSGRLMSAMLDLLAESDFDTSGFEARMQPLVISLANHPDARTRTGVALLLGPMGGDAALDALTTLYADTNSDVRAAALFAHAHLDPQGVRPWIAEVLDMTEIDLEMCHAALDAIELTRWRKGAALLGHAIHRWAEGADDAHALELLSRANALIADSAHWNR